MAGSKPILVDGPQGVRPCSPCDPSQMRSFRNTLSQARLSISRSDSAPGVQRVRLRGPERLWFNHARYDGDGRRVMKQVDSATPTVYIYDASGALAGEVGAPPMTGCTTCYLSVAYLGSTRAVTDSSGSVVERHDYLPFGEVIYSGTGSRTAALKYILITGSSGLTDKFTGKERDAETGLGYFGARYFSGAQGRFTSPDSTALL